MSLAPSVIITVMSLRAILFDTLVICVLVVAARGMAVFRRAFRSKMLYDMIFESTFTTIEENQYV